jgi:non-canonical (house-cleaning) NTP pyrophosphatase
MVEDSHEDQEQPVTITRTVIFADTRASETGSDAHLIEDFGIIEDPHEVQEQPVTITRTVIFATTKASEIGSAGG